MTPTSRTSADSLSSTRHPTRPFGIDDSDDPKCSTLDPRPSRHQSRLAALVSTTFRSYCPAVVSRVLPSLLSGCSRSRPSAPPLLLLPPAPLFSSSSSMSGSLRAPSATPLLPAPPLPPLSQPLAIARLLPLPPPRSPPPPPPLSRAHLVSGPHHLPRKQLRALLLLLSLPSRRPPPFGYHDPRRKTLSDRRRIDGDSDSRGWQARGLRA